MLNWVDKNERLPTEEDANESMLYGVTVDGKVMNVHITHFTTMSKHFTHWLPYSEMPVPKRWRVPTIHDLAKAGKSIPCRVKGIPSNEWLDATLEAVHIEPTTYRYFANNEWWYICEICDA